MKAAVLDIETTDLGAVGAGILLVCCVKPLGEDVRAFRLDKLGCRPGHENELVEAITFEISKYDLLIGHNIENFDWGFLKTRAVVLGLPFYYRPFVYDTLKAFKRIGLRSRLNGFGKPSAGMAMVVDLLGIEQSKTSIYPQEWWMSVWGDEAERNKAMNEITAHCVEDVCMNEEMYWRLLRLDQHGTLRRFK